MSTPTKDSNASSKMEGDPLINPPPKFEEENIYDASDDNEEENIYYASDDNQDELHASAIKVKTPEPAPAQVDQYGDPMESPDEFRMEIIREQGITGFMTKVVSRLRTLPDKHDRLSSRHHLMDLVRELQVDKTSQTPYNEPAAERICHFLEEKGLGETLLLDFELLLRMFEERAQKDREAAEKRKQELEEEQRKKQEWDIVREEDADDGWEMV